MANSFTLFMVFIIWIRSVWSLVANQFTIEGWEQERHSTLLRRARVFGGWLDGPDGTRIRIQHQEYPYDIGLWSNAVQGMGTWNVRPALSSLNTSMLTFHVDTGLVLAIRGITDYSKCHSL